MPAEWQLRAYRVDLGKLTKLVGSKDKALATAVKKAGKKSKLDEDDRIEDELTFAAIVDELVAGVLNEDHTCGYRIALEAFADVTALRLKFDVNAASKNYDALTTYADRDDLGPILKKLGLRTLAKGWDANTIAWPWAAKGPGHDWPSASYWTAAQLATSATELAAAAKKRPARSLAERAKQLTADEFFADDNADAITVIAQLTGKARGKLATKRRCCAGAGDGLLVLADGER